jgi:predicted nuclease with TOPRIM domain
VEGLGGRIKELRRELQQDHDDSQAQRKAVEEKAAAKLEAVQADMSDVKAGQAKLESDMTDVKANMADVKTLLEKLVAQSSSSLA